MSYQVLARKWRPHTFEEMIGQEYILRMISNALEQQRLHHAYLFTGTRGVGKTTIARILAKCLNCEVGVSAQPCGTCGSCQAIDAGKFLDLYEIDAASRTKVEDTRELLENVFYPPTQGRYKIYLIDEIHMLSNHSFNALLKTLEEPPEYVKFLLCTTDPKKLPVTILSRCLQFHLKQIPVERIVNYLQTICQQEHVASEVSALEKLAEAATGSMRDALSLLDQAIAYGNGQVNNQDVHAMLGCLARENIVPLLTALSAQDGKQLFDHVAALNERAPDFQQVLEDLIHIFHQIAIKQVVPDFKMDANLEPLIALFNPEDIQLYYQIALLGRRDIQFTPSPQQGFEMTLLRMLAFKPSLTDTTPISQPAPLKIVAPQVQVAAPVQKEEIEKVTPADVTPPASTTAVPLPDWRDILPKLELSGMAYALASNCTLDKCNGDAIELVLSESHSPMLNKKLEERIQEALTRHFKQCIQLKIKTTTGELFTPLKQQQQESQQRVAEAQDALLKDPKIQKLIEMYDATIEVSLVT